MSQDIEDTEESTLESISEFPPVRRDTISLLFLSAVTALIGIYVLVFGLTSPYTRQKFAVLIIGSSAALFFLYDCMESKFDLKVIKYTDQLFSFLLGLGSAIVAGYFFFFFQTVSGRTLSYPLYEYVFAGFLVFAIVEGTRRAFGLALTSFIYVAFLYAIFGDMLPAPLNHPGFSLARVLETTVLNYSGLFGSIGVIGSTWVLIFILYAGVITEFDSLEYIFGLSRNITDRVNSGSGQISVISSFVAGSITGSAAANSAITGSFTIPMMKDSGLRAETAAAIESTSSTGGQILPPIMGASAFLMAEILGIPYADIVVFATLPALLFYLSVVVSVAIISNKQNVSETTDVNTSQTVLNNIDFIISIAVLFAFLLYLRYDPFTAGVYTIIAYIVSNYIFNTLVHNMTSNGNSLPLTSFKRNKKTIFSFVNGMKTIMPLMLVIGSIAIVVQLISLTGITQIIAQTMLSVGSTSIIVLLLGALMSILFGMGMPTVAAYLLVSIFVVPSLTQFGIADIYAHFFVFYFAIISGLTPPIAVVVAVAARIADADFIDSCLEALVFALPGYILPFAFIYNTELLIWDITTWLTFPIVLVGLTTIVCSVIGYVNRDLSSVERVLIFTFGAGSIFTPILYIQAIFALFSLIFTMRATNIVNELQDMYSGTV